MPKWRNKIEIKNNFTDDESNETTKLVCEKLIPQLQHIKIIEGNKPESKKLDEDFLDDFSNLIDEFKWIIEMIDNNEDPNEYSFSTWLEAFNEYLGQLYDMGDSVSTGGTFFDREKFMWVG